jgi:NAD-dependent deacetylase
LRGDASPWGRLVRGSPPIVEFARAERAAREAELVLVVGTSSLVYPAASLPSTALDAGAYVVRDQSRADAVFGAASERLAGPAGVVLPSLLAAAGIPMGQAA